jgi:UDP-N-acetylglucosamine 2-epimerase (non-hydrolysing)
MNGQRPPRGFELRLVPDPPPPDPGGARSTVVHAVGTRPDLVKMAPVIAALARRGAFRQVVVDTGRDADAALAAGVRADLGVAEPDHRLELGAGTQAEETAAALTGFERLLVAERPELVLVAGETNASLGCALAAAKLEIAVAHLEAGLRTWDWTSPEEINRVLVDRLSDTLFTHSAEATENLMAEGVADGRIHAVGSTTVDALRACEVRARARGAWLPLGLREREYVLVSLQHPSNVDDRARLERIVIALAGLAEHVPVLLPLDPTIAERLEACDGLATLDAAGVRRTGPLGYLDFLSLQAGAGSIVTDSGAVQEEASALGVCCYTLRATTERPVTLTHGTNVLLGDDPDAIAGVRPSPWAPTPCAIPMWDGRAAERAADALVANYALAGAHALS